MFKDYQMAAIRRNLDLFSAQGYHGNEVKDAVNVNEESENVKTSSSVAMNSELDDSDNMKVNMERRVDNSEETKNWSRSCEGQRSLENQRSQLDIEKDYCVDCFQMNYSVKPLAYHSRMIRNFKVSFIPYNSSHFFLG